MLLRSLASLFLALCFLPALAAEDPLDAYVKRLREDHSGARRETGFLSPGSDFLYGQEALEGKNYGSAAFSFREVLRKQSDNAFARYQLGIALLHDSDETRRREGQQELDKALAANPALRARLARDVPPPAAPATAPGTGEPAGTPRVPGDAKPAQPPAAGSLEAYIAGLRESQKTGGPATAMNTAGREALYGIEYYEAKSFDSAATSFGLALARDAANPYLRYLLAVSLGAQGKDDAAQTHRNAAVAGDASLAARFPRELAAAKLAWQAKVEAGKPNTTPAPGYVYGGALVFGNYVCLQTVWN